MRKEIPLEQRKGVFKRCKDCNGYGIRRYKVEWSNTPEYEESFMAKCKTCNGTGRLTWLDKMVGR